MNTEEQEKPAYTLSLKGEGIALERELTKDIALAVINVALGGTPASALTPHTGATSIGKADGGSRGSGSSTSAGDRITPGEFIEDRNAGTNPEKIVAFGVFLNDAQGQGNFTREDIKSMFRAAHETSPANFGRDFRAALASNWIAAENDASDRYFVTKTGKKAVNDQFTVVRPRKPRRKGSRKASGASEG